MGKDKANPKTHGPQSPLLDESLAEATGEDLEAWVAVEIDGFKDVKRVGSKWRGKHKGTDKPVPAYRGQIAVLSQQVLEQGRKLVLSGPSGEISLNEASTALLEAALRALILESMRLRGAI